MNKLIFFTCLFCITFISCGSKKVTSTHNEEIYSNMIDGSRQDSILKFGFQYLNTPYRYGGITPKGFDCSGYTYYVFNQFGYDIPRSSRTQANYVQTVRKGNLKPADLVFFEGRSRNGRVGHVGIVTEVKPNNEFNFIHASTSQGVVVSSSNEPYWAYRYIKGGRLIEDNNRLFITNSQNAPSTVIREKEPLVKLSQPSKSSEKVVAEEPDVMKQPTNVHKQFHIVKRGETLIDLSRIYDVPVSTLRYLNNLKNNRLKKGQKIKLHNDDTRNNSLFIGD